MTIIIKTVNNIRKGRKPEEKTIEDLGEQTKRYKEAMKIKKRSEKSLGEFEDFVRGVFWRVEFQVEGYVSFFEVYGFDVENRLTE